MIKPRKRFGQHWLKSEIALENIIKTAQLKREDRILEIGPGTGILTERLLPQVNQVLAVEIDRDLCKLLRTKFAGWSNFLLLEGDFLAQEFFPGFLEYNKVVANIPYYITGPILEKLLGTISKPSPKQLEFIVLLIQKEVAERLVAKPGNKNYGALTLKVRYLADCEIVCKVPAKAFYPPPKVDSVVVKITPRKIDNPPKNPAFLEKIIRMGFNGRRKMLKNNLKPIVKPELLEVILANFNINPQVRAEDLDLQDWILLSNILSDSPDCGEG
ncbi:MAG: 16S rRNA (adenine(1518)-N(6)/adenine(1519)-N(6))-dimethyltransferase RsmA [Geminocystis sp.]|nr:16S rRNA (adenine(1518)-N(6)/adenine(1519)-N(6))-dimethyltransferase RsmA [Geminocystis sp.]MCS7148570.1 16S rRNA (adenine(1518)-N(6)/adenine(1519)-N(6))-dimethyltransferase RsmA [Geminocystis sp.]MCX8078167.1 16S rRNA (adenine(1518)-N(6)/adenine(1519)-N(6))-dimethyltransferase RsmA [Geminocystis sp.]MDW8115038.1 16S rRNA (adenine(1518)-N(6)/adenine(1519)-N(6))-dimethyltransferase RsmA [Geminocystis sp.]MDW8464306.1 16S rRNA (adenine(1518)-N(6)/adenine(1519)-N(6))-dimethyltransferase RsmA [G